MRKIILAAFIGHLAVLHSNFIFANEIWEGPGKMYGRDRVVKAEYQVEVDIVKSIASGE